ncbi:MAG: peptide deformylase [Oscillospiraceae bacterium]|nr:peptide deformylase [Oscillospiraceae bacterium]
MVRMINRDVLFLSKKSEKAVPGDESVGKDLLDTLAAHADDCVGMAANMIGVSKNIIVFNTGFMNMLMFNPRIVKKSGRYETEEGCLSLQGVRPCVRFKEIEVEYEDMSFTKKRMKLSDFPAQIVQHEIDHLNGIII